MINLDSKEPDMRVDNLWTRIMSTQRQVANFMRIDASMISVETISTDGSEFVQRNVKSVIKDYMRKLVCVSLDKEQVFAPHSDFIGNNPEMMRTL
jgi:thioesterase domain-containing protein